MSCKRFIFLCLICLITSFSWSLAAAAGEIAGYAEYAAGIGGPAIRGFNIDTTDYTEGIDVTAADGCLLTGSSSLVTYSFNVPESGAYYIEITYKAEAGGVTIARSLRLNGQTPFAEAENLVFERFYKDANQDYKEQTGNQAFPTQVEAEVWRVKPLSSANGFITEPFRFYLEKGRNTLTLEAVDSSMWIKDIAFVPAQGLKSYEDYEAYYRNLGAEKVSGVDAVKVQGQDASLKSSPSLYPINDRTSALTEPYHPYYIVLNAIGGYSWSTPGQIIEWDVTVPKAGLYRVAFKAKQARNRGVFSVRRLRINGQIPFEEAQELRFNYNTRFSIGYLGGDDGDYYFYLNEGTNTISLEAAMGVYGSLADRVSQVLSNLNGYYRDIIVVTSANPDKYRDYQLHVLMPDLFPNLARERNRLAAISAEIGRISGDYAVSTTSIDRLVKVLSNMVSNPLDVASYLGDFKSCVTSLGDWMMEIQSQPLTIDYFIVAPEGYDLPRADDNFFERLWHSIRAFFGSFINKYDSGTTKGSGAKTIEVWVTTGRDQFQILQRLISESFTPYSGINVNVKLVAVDTVYPATLTGRGPDVGIQLAASTPLNFGYRGGAYDLRQFKDFDDVAARFLPAAVEAFTFKGKTYALPDQMSFPVLFYRTDIFNDLKLSPPETLKEFLEIVPVLQQSNMDIYFTTVPQTTLGAQATSGAYRNINPVYLSLLYQNGGTLYNNDGESSAITSEVGVASFKQWTELFTKHGFIVETDFVTRFRLGEIPVGIVDFTVYNTLSAGAPEIMGDWAIAQVPGTRQKDGTVNHTVPLTLSGAVIVKNTVERKGTADESWEFLKWWTSADTQYTFAREMEAVLGLAGRYPVANLEAFAKIDWGKENLIVLTQCLESARAVPQVPGSYITGRVIENAFLSVVTASSNKNPNDVIYEAVEQINRELTSKRKEFGITD